MTDARRQSSFLVGLIGSAIQASLTPATHEREADENGLRYIYRLIDIEKLGLGVEVLPELLTAAERVGFAGVNITHPCKQTVIPLLHEPSDVARGRQYGRSVERAADRPQHRLGRCRELPPRSAGG